MREVTCSYQHAEGAAQVAQILEGKVSPSVLSDIQGVAGTERVGILDFLRVGGHISDPFMRARQLAEMSHIRQIVVFNDSYFVIGADGECSGPLAAQCHPTPDDAQNWAHTAIRWQDAERFAEANIQLPERPAE